MNFIAQNGIAHREDSTVLVVIGKGCGDVSVLGK